MLRNLGMCALAVVATACLLLSTAIGVSAATVNLSTGSGSLPTAASFGSFIPVGSSTGRMGPCTQAIVPLRAAGVLRVLAGTTVTNTGATVVKGNLGVSPGSAVTGFPPGRGTGAIDRADTAAAYAQTALVTAYNNAIGRTNLPVMVSGNFGGRTLGPGLYHAPSSLSPSSGDLTLSTHGHSGADFVFQVTTKFTTLSGRKVILAGGARASHIVWAVGSSATFGTMSGCSEGFSRPSQSRSRPGRH